MASTRHSTTTTSAADGSLAMEDHARDDVQNSDSAISGLTSLSGDDAFEQRMIEKAREEQRRRDGSGQAFRKARTHPRVRLTMDNLERSDAQRSGGGGGGGALARVAPSRSPPSSSGSTRSDPAIHAPAGWGRKGRTSRDWMRAITRNAPAQPPTAAASGHDSPLSHKSFPQAPTPAPRQDSTGELDLTFDMNEASMLVSTPYMPRSTKLDLIRERELEALRDQRLATARLGKENSPMAVYTKSVETLGVVERHVVASAERPPARPFTSRRTDSQDLLRRLARVSNTPSPKPAATRDTAAVTTPAASRHHPPPRDQRQDTPPDATARDEIAPNAPAPDATVPDATTRDAPAPDAPAPDAPAPDSPAPDVPSSAPAAAAGDATPMPTERPAQNPQTPYVMGGWLDTPGPRIAHESVHLPQPRPSSPQQSHASNPPTLEDDRQPAQEQPTEHAPPPVPRPLLPSSALHALVQEARVHHDYGDDTMHSLEELLGPLSDNEGEEDTLHGLTLPTSAPRSEAERERYAETLNVHRLREHLRATETSVRDASRGMRRLETLIEHSKNGQPSERLPVIVRDVRTDFSPWVWFRSFFWNERLKTQRQVKDAPLRMWGGVTLLSMLLTLSFIWWASETVACEMFCHPEYASYSPYPFAVNMDAPKRGVVIPTLVYRTFFRSWSTPVVSPVVASLSGLGSSFWSLGSGINMNALRRASYGAAGDAGPASTAHTQASWTKQEDAHEEESWEWSMAEDEVLQR